ncbi:unnamed protein product [Polarella glacialis]|uniref:Uncharacterized protein n=1 Tax=Polarella glacialis TaxID=89957 RepID=A0A813LWC3_POLGL|nr:unnamed protein product [Polarella glacialis]
MAVKPVTPNRANSTDYSLEQQHLRSVPIRFLLYHFSLLLFVACFTLVFVVDNAFQKRNLIGTDRTTRNGFKEFSPRRAAAAPAGEHRAGGAAAAGGVAGGATAVSTGALVVVVVIVVVVCSSCCCRHRGDKISQQKVSSVNSALVHAAPSNQPETALVTLHLFPKHHDRT